eukprot:scaffold232732_cov22-Tisochrysis_lutea.AAC.1
MGRAQQRLINPHAKQGFNAGVVYSVQSTFNATTQEHSEHTHTLTHNTHTHTNASTSESTRSTGLLFSSLQHNSHMFHLQQQVTMELHWTHAHHTSTCVHTPLAAHMGQLHGSAYPCSAGPPSAGPLTAAATAAVIDAAATHSEPRHPLHTHPPSFVPPAGHLSRRCCNCCEHPAGGGAAAAAIHGRLCPRQRWLWC